MSSSSKDAFDTGVFRALADFGFERFATPKLLRVLYIIGFVVVLVYGIGFLVGGLIQGGGLAFMALIGVPLGVLASLLYLRVTMELLAVVFRVGQNTSRMVELAEAGTFSAPGAVPGTGDHGRGYGGPQDPPVPGGPPGPSGSSGPGSPPPSPNPET